MRQNTYKIPDGEWLVIVNPNSGRRKGEHDWSEISGMLASRGIRYRAIFTRHRLHAIRLTADFIRRGFRKFIVVGGDGTLNEVVNGVMSQSYCPSTDVLLAMIPVGTGNDWCRTHKISSSYQEAISTIAEAQTFLHDLGHVQYFENGNIKERYFINMAGIGYDALVAQKTNRQKDLGKAGPLSYFINIFTSLFYYKHIVARIRLENKVVDAKVFSMNVGICRFNGGGMMQAPFASPDDGLLDLTIIKKLSKLAVIRHVAKLFDGSFTRLPMVFTGQGKEIEVLAQQPMLLEADGESIGQTPCHFTSVPAKIRVISGQ